MRKPRKNYTPSEKVAILRRHLIDRVAVSDLCDEYQLQPALFYTWQKHLLRERHCRLRAQERESRGRIPTHHRRAARQAPAQERSRRRTHGRTRPTKKRAWGALTKAWVPHDIRDAVVDYVRHWSERTEIPVRRFITWLGIAQSKFHDWRERYGLANEHNALVPRDWWLEEWEKQAILAFHADHLLDGYRRLAFMMLDADVVAVSPSSVYRVLRDAGLMKRHNIKSSLKGKGFDQPLKPHEHWHVDFAYLNIAGTFFFLCTLLDGYSRSIVHWEIRPNMTRGRRRDDHPAGTRKFPDARPRIISDNGPQFISPGFQGVHPDLRNDSCEDVTILSAKQRQDRTLAPFGEIRVYPPRHTPVAGGRAAARGGLRAALQRGTASQCDRLRDPCR